MKELLQSKKGKVIAGVVAALAIVAVVVMAMSSGDKKGFRTISISEIFGTVTANKDNKEYEAYEGMKLSEGYSLTTALESQVRMVLDDDKYIKVEEDSKVVFEELGKEGSGRTAIKLEYGAITNEVTSALGKEDEYIINTPNSVLAIRGTFFRVEVREDNTGNVLTDVYTYGGKVESRRILPNGEIVEESVMIDAGYKTTVSMDTEETIYVIEKTEDGKENVEPINIEDIPDADLVDIFVAAADGHEMFLQVEEVWEVIEEREINVEDFTSNRDGEKVVPLEAQPEETKHVEETVVVEATCTTDGYTRVVCSDCGEVLSETVVPATGHSKHNNQVTKTAATCTSAGKEVTTCSVCHEVASVVQIAPLAHKTVETRVEPTFTTTGKSTKTCTVCNQVVSTTTLPKWTPLYVEDGNIFIKSNGYSQGDGALVPYTGDYVIASRTSSLSIANIIVTGAETNITMDGVNMDGTFEVSEGAVVNLYGTGNKNVINNKRMGGAAVHVGSSLNVYSGKYKLYGGSTGVEGTGDFWIYGGSLYVDADTTGDVITSYYPKICGGSLRLGIDGQGSSQYSIMNMRSMTTSCQVFNQMPSIETLTYTVEGETYVYNLTEADRDEDGNFYVWLQGH